MSIEISEFKLQSITIEVRFEPAFALWDHAGKLALDLQKPFPTLKPKGTPQPNQQIYVLRSGIEATVQIGAAHIGEKYPAHQLTELLSSADVFFALVLTRLLAADLSRIGLRVIFEKKFPTKKDVAVYLCERQKAFRRTGGFFNITDGAVLEPLLSLRWEGHTLGCMVKLTSQEQRLEVEIPREFTEVPKFDSQRTVALLDVDYYTHTNTPVSRFKASAIIEGWMKVIRRDLGGFLGD